MKFILLLPALFFSSSIFADTLTCVWQNNAKYATGYFRHAQFDLALEKDSAHITRDTYFERYYEPCWTGKWKNCSFSFEHNSSKKWETESQTPTKVTLYQNNNWFNASLEFHFSQSLASLPKEASVLAILNGDDGDGTFIESDKFVCTKH